MYTTFLRSYKNYVPDQPAHTMIFSKTYNDLFQEIKDIATEFILRHYIRLVQSNGATFSKSYFRDTDV